MRVTKIVLIVLVGVWGLLGGIGNLVNYAGGHAAVVAVMARDEVPFAPGGPFVAITQPALTHLGYAVIWVGKLASALACLWGALRLWGVRSAPAVQFNATKTVALAGCGIALLMLFGGFVVVGGSYFGMWSTARGQLSTTVASQYITSIGIIALFVAMPDQ
jgi:predicted small integral membrane protein